MFFKQGSFPAMLKGGCFAVLLTLCCGTASFAEKPPTPNVRLPLRTLGFPGHPIALMHAGRSMATLHLLDNSHLLFTYSLRSLVPRIPGDDENDSDRLVAAEIVEIPSGKVLARTEWHLHDYGRYLWTAGDGVFVVRIRDELSSFSPLRGLASGEAFQRVSLPHRPGLPQVITSSPDGTVLMVQIEQPGKRNEEDADREDGPKKKHVVIEFYRLVAPTEPGLPVQFRRAGVIGSPGLLNLALDGDGYLWADDKARNRWGLSFNEYEGKPQDLAALDSSCSPHLELMSRSQFIALSCRGTDDAHLLSVYGFDGHETWEEPFGEALQLPVFLPAPTAGRFAMSRLTADSGAPGMGVSGVAPESTRQEIRVYQTESGQLLLSVHPSPVMRTAQNFDLSADGRTLAVLGSDAIDLYRLPELSARDRKDLAEVATMAPPVSHGPVTLHRITRPIAVETPAGDTAGTPGAPVPPAPNAGAEPAQPAAGDSTTPADTASGSAAEGNGTARAAVSRARGAADGEPSTDAPRKPPTLLAPGEAAQYKSKAQTGSQTGAPQ